MHATPTADMELEMRLDAYARARLSLSPKESARIRADVMLEAHRALGPSRAGSRPDPAPIALSSNPARARLRRGGALLLAAGLAVGVLGGTAAAAQPGGLLYGARVWVEAATLPSDPSDRAIAEIHRLEARLVEIESAAAKGDRGAVEAAVAAYGQIADEALGEAGTDTANLDRLRIALDRHLAVLRGVAASAPSQAQEAISRNIDRALEHNDATIESIVARTPPPNANTGGNGQTGGNGSGGNQGGGAVNPAGGGDPNATPDATKKPHPTPKPDTTPEPAAATPNPPGPTDNPGGGGKPSQNPGGGGNGQGGNP